MRSTLSCALIILLAPLPASGVTNDWTKPTSGNWEESYWSLGQLPGINQDLVAFRNSGWKALAIGAGTTANFPASLSLNNLLVEAPTNSANQLLLNWAGLSVPLLVQSNLTIGTNGSLVSHYSAIRAGNVDIDGTATFLDYATENFDQLTLRSGATVGLTNGSMTSSNLVFEVGTFTQSGGTHAAQEIRLPLNPTYDQAGDGVYNLQDGVLMSGHLQLGYVAAPYGPIGHGNVLQSGGIHTNMSMSMSGYYSPNHRLPAGGYILKGGLLVSDSITNDGGFYVQENGTNLVRELDVLGGSAFELNGGELITSNANLPIDSYVGGAFIQVGGTFNVLNTLAVLGPGYVALNPPVEFKFYGGNVIASNVALRGGTLQVFSNATLVTSNIQLDGGTLDGEGGTISNQLLTFAGGTLAGRCSPASQLGSIQVSDGGRIEAPPGALLKFQDSHDIPWSGLLSIRWSPQVRVFVGISATSLTAAQLTAITFEYSNGTNNGAALLPTGELVPAGVNRSDGYTYVATNHTVVILGYVQAEGALVIPSTLDGLPVSGIGYRAFFNAELTSVSIPDTVTFIGSSAFDSCANLTNVSLGNGVARIGYRAFSGCPALASVTIPNGVTNIDDHAFYDCSSLSNVTIGSGLLTLGAQVFGNCPSLTAFSVSPSNKAYSSLAGVLLDKEQRTIIQYPVSKFGNYFVPDTVRTITASAFAYATQLTGINGGSNLDTIDAYAFSGCVSLTNISLLPNLKTIGADAFAYCVNLTNISLLPNLRIIGGAAFAGCGSLMRVAMGDYLESIGYRAFYRCYSLADISLGSRLTTIGANAFESCESLRFISIPNGVTAIPNNAFLFCSSLTNVILGSGVTSIGYFAFGNCPKLTAITIPDGVTVITSDAFFGCDRLEYVLMGKGVHKIGNSAFGLCTKLTAVYFRGDSPIVDDYLFQQSPMIAYYLPGTVGWGTTLGGRPVEPWYLPKPVILDFGPSFGVRTNRFGFVISWATNISIVVEASTSLATPVWFRLSTNALVGGSCYFADGQWSNYPSRFYRIHPL